MSHPYFSLPEASRIRAALGPVESRFVVEVVPECESTNTVLMAHPPADDGRVHVLVARRQTGGRGRRGRRWESWDGASLTFSSVWRFPPGAPVPAGLSLVVGVALARTVEALGLSDVRLKWPNDLQVDGAKLAGILVELMPGRGRTPAAVVGIGINLAAPPEEMLGGQPVTGLQAHLSRVPDASEVLALLLQQLLLAFNLYEQEGFIALRGDWDARNAFAGQAVRLTGEGEPVEGICLGADVDGALLLDCGGVSRRILSGELSLRPAP